MAGICCEVVEERETASAAVEPTSSRAKRRTRLELRPFTLLSSADVAIPEDATPRKRPMLDTFKDLDNALKNLSNGSKEPVVEIRNNHKDKFGMTSVCGRRRDMEDAVSIHTSFSTDGSSSFFGVFDGHGCFHVAMRCRDRLHEIVKEEMAKFPDAKSSEEWNELMERSFRRMDKDVEDWTASAASASASAASASASAASASASAASGDYNCRCELRIPQCDAVGSTAVVSVLTPDKIVVSNCGDSRAVLCRNGTPIPLSSDHKPDKPDELHRIEAAGGRVIYWDVARVLGVLAMSRAIGDIYLKPFVIPVPEVTVTERTEEDECLIIASDGLWDVVTNETACGVARMCLRAQKPLLPIMSEAAVVDGAASDLACSYASILLTKLALARHSTDNVSVVVVDLRRRRRRRRD